MKMCAKIKLERKGTETNNGYQKYSFNHYLKKCINLIWN